MVTSDQSYVCPICLSSVDNEAYTDTCKHCFCLRCIVQWTEYEKSKAPEVVSFACPLCKGKFSSLYHSVVVGDCDRLYLNPHSKQGFQLLSSHRERRRIYLQQPDGEHAPPQKALQPLSLGTANTKQLIPWLTHELQALTRGTGSILIPSQLEDVDIIVKHVAAIVQALAKEQSSKKGPKRQKTDQKDWQSEVASAVSPFIFEHSAKFTEELALFLSGGGKFTPLAVQNAEVRSVALQETSSENSPNSAEAETAQSPEGNDLQDFDVEAYSSVAQNLDLGFGDDEDW